MNINLVFEEHQIDRSRLLMLRHTPTQRRLKAELPFLAESQPNVFNAYQQTQSSIRNENLMAQANHVASFIGDVGNKAIFVGLYKKESQRIISQEEYWTMPVHQSLRHYGLEQAAPDTRPNALLFDLQLLPLMQSMRGKLIVEWPQPIVNFVRWAENNTFPIHAILEESKLTQPLSDWREIVWSWNKLQNLPHSWREALKHWGAIYLIHDRSDGKNYIGSASGEENLWGRWQNYADTGDGGNVLLRDRGPESLEFSILERISPDMIRTQVVELETSWKKRLHTLAPSGLNLN